MVINIIYSSIKLKNSYFCAITLNNRIKYTEQHYYNLLLSNLDSFVCLIEHFSSPHFQKLLL